MPRPTGRLLAGPLAAILAGAGVTLAAPAQAVPSTSVVISEVYGGGGNVGASYTHDFVELYNLGNTPVDLSTWQVRYASATNTGTGAATQLKGSIAPGASYLVQMSGGTVGQPLPKPDVTGTAAMSATAGRVDLANGSLVVDRVGYGSSAAVLAEAPAAATPSNSTSVSRTSPCTDTDNNAADFTVGSPSPRNATAEALSCTPRERGPVVPETIQQIQGSAHLSPLADRPVDGVEGVVTAVGGNGFWMQSLTPDADLATSEGLFVFTRSAPTVVVGTRVSVSGAVTEFRADNDNLSTTEIYGATVTLNGTAPVPAPVVLGVDRTAPPQTIERGDPGNVEAAGAPFRPDVDAIDFYESLEGMRVAVRDARVVGPTASFGEIPVVPGDLAAGSAVRSARGGVVYSGYESPNAMRVQLDDALVAGRMPAANVGDTLSGTTSGVLDYSFANFKLEVTEPPTVRSGGLEREVTEAQGASELAVATFNVENLAPSDPATKFQRLAGQIVRNLRSPDVLALEEIQDDSGATNDGTVTSGRTVKALVDAIVAAGGPRYEGRWVDPENGTDGGQPGGNIRQVLLFRPDRGVSFVDRPGGNATTAVRVGKEHGDPQLSVSPGRIAPADPAWESSRKPLVGQLRFRGHDVFVIANHFASKGGDDPLFGRWQQPERSSEEQRHAQAKAVRAFVDELLDIDRNAEVVVLGDLNDFEFSTTADLLVGSGRTALVDLPRTLPAAERYSYVFEGNSQVLDHILVSQRLAKVRDGRPAYEYDVVHTNAEFHDQDSDHDPQVVRLDLSRG